MSPHRALYNCQMVKKRVKLSTLGSRITSIVSVSLVLYIIGLLAALAVVTHRITDSLLGEVAIVVKVDPLASESEIEALGSALEALPCANECAYTSAQQVLMLEMEYQAEELALLDENPFSPEFEIKLKPAYVNADSIEMVSNQLMLMAGVDEVVSQVDLVSSVHSATRRIAIGLSAVAAVLLVISLVLIFNTVSISVYGRRFVIHTMQLVGAKAGFIRRPFVWAAILSGIISAIVAIGALVGTEAYVASLNLELNLSLHWQELALLAAALLGLGIAICGLSALCATNRYLSQSIDNLYS